MEKKSHSRAKSALCGTFALLPEDYITTNKKMSKKLLKITSPKSGGKARGLTSPHDTLLDILVRTDTGLKINKLNKKMKNTNSFFADQTEEDFDTVTIKLIDALFREVRTVDFLMADYRDRIDTDRVYDHLGDIRFITKKLKRHVSRLDNLKNGITLQKNK